MTIKNKKKYLGLQNACKAEKNKNIPPIVYNTIYDQNFTWIVSLSRWFAAQTSV